MTRWYSSICWGRQWLVAKGFHDLNGVTEMNAMISFFRGYEYSIRQLEQHGSHAYTFIHIHKISINNAKIYFFPQVIKRGYVKMYNYQFKADPCLCWFHQGHSSGYLICIQTTVFSYLEDSSQWTTTWPEVYDVHTDTELISPCSLSFILSLLSTTRRPSSWISSLLWEPRQL